MDLKEYDKLTLTLSRAKLLDLLCAVNELNDLFDIPQVERVIRKSDFIWAAISKNPVQLNLFDENESVES